MKKFICIILSVVTFVFSFCFAAGALDVSINQGKDALVSQWQKAEGFGLDYRLYSPVKGQGDRTKYPLVVLLHGKYSGSKEGEQLTATDFFKWSSSEYQSRFSDTGGAYILMPRTPGGDGNTWTNSGLRDKLKNLIDDFIAKNIDTVDTSRIYLGGWSMGGAGAVSMASEHSGFFAAVIIIAPFDSVTQGQVDKLKDTPTWVVTCTKDATASHGLFAKPLWNKIRDTTNIPSLCRYTTFSKYNYYDGGHHYVHFAVAADLLAQPSDCGMKTVDATGRTIITNENESIITWLSAQRLGQAKDEDPCRCNCHSKKGFTKFFWSIQLFFYRIFSPSKKTCACGTAHW